jgi:aminodeoxyfutalosine deaminase
MPAAGMREFVAALPKAELHLHLVGSASPETVLALARRHPDGGVPAEPEALRRFYAFAGFSQFLDVYARVNLLVRTGADVVTLLDGLAAQLAASRVRYAEVQVRSSMAATSPGSGTASSWAGSSTPTPRSARRVRWRPSRSRWGTGPRARSASGSAGRRPG